MEWCILILVAAGLWTADRQGLYLIWFCILVAVVYGILHDQVTARVCVEYFTVGHPPLFSTDNPTALALGWGILGTWWVGLLLGVPLALAARAGYRPKLTTRDFVRPAALLLICMGATALVAGAGGYLAARRGWVWLLEPLALRVPADKHAAFLADVWAHLASYLSGALGGVVTWFWAWRKRGRLMLESPQLSEPAH
jgi:hypothetical protein